LNFASAFSAHIIDLALPLPERQLISRLRQAAQVSVARAQRDGIVAGIGDDCSILRLPARHDALVTTDFSLEGIHFRREWHPPESVGHRCLTRGLSDIAAMGGKPIAAFLSLALPSKLPQAWVDGFMSGLLALAMRFGAVLAGGDTASSPAGVLADITVLGSIPKGGAILRSNARPGDRIFVTGALGGSAATLDLLYSKNRKLNPGLFPAHFFPTPRIAVGRILRQKNTASSMIDISDGLSTDLSHICEESSVGAQINEQAVPGATFGRPSGMVGLNFALHGGDDYELLFTARPHTHVPRSIAGVPITEIGEITRRKGMSLVRENGRRSDLRPGGWQHFASSSKSRER
jgi:thiamine-monophosphate kinase